ncbi:hypothetical protein FCULG_00000111 [Fusarium culmorum]|uniref:Uncharacterized protein n=1 Tax=Fusarium culmorum TaxID=5516 RepID=A0A2T4GNM4_FUSCU|nr:hypothetical protein FCULG_00000111 [Fusarium culmorum]
MVLTAVEVKVEWSKNLTNYSEQYYTVPFFNKDNSQYLVNGTLVIYTDSTIGKEESVIFIQKSYLEALKSKRAPGDDLTIIVDDSFQYGQNKEKTKRWLAFHNKKNEAYHAALKFANGFFPSIDLGMLLKLLFGDYLHNF